MTMRPPDDLHDPRFDDAWRRASREEPPRALDDAIRAAARREVGARPQDVSNVREATRPERWWFPLAAAAVIGTIAIGVLQLTSTERVAPPEERAVSDIPPGAKDVPLKPPEPVAKPEQAPASAPLEAPKTARESKRQLAPSSSLAKRLPRAEPQAFPSAPRDALRADEKEKQALEPQSKKAESADARSTDKLNAAAAGAVAPAAPVAQAPPPAAAPSIAFAPRAVTPQRSAASVAASRPESTEALAKERVALSVDDWIALMRRLRDERRFDELAKEIAAFRSLHADADAVLPQDLREAVPAAR